MRKCSNCGEITTNPSINFCENCGRPLVAVQNVPTQPTISTPYITAQQPIRTSSTVQQPVSNSTSNSNRIAVVRELNNKKYVNILDNGSEKPAFIMTSDEKHVKTYHCSTLRWWRGGGNGYLSVTNKRVIMNTFGKRVTQSSEVELPEVKGFNIYNGYVYRILVLIGAILMALSTVITFFAGIANCDSCETGSAVFWALIVSAGLTVLLFFLSRRKVYYLGVSSSCQNGPVDCGMQEIRKWFWFIIPLTWVDQGVLVSALSGNDWERIRVELGAMVQELKTQGDEAIPNWKQ